MGPGGRPAAHSSSFPVHLDLNEAGQEPGAVVHGETPPDPEQAMTASHVTNCKGSQVLTTTAVHVPTEQASVDHEQPREHKNEAGQEPGLILDGETPDRYPPGPQQVMATRHVRKEGLVLASTAVPTAVEQPREHKARSHDGMLNIDHEAVVQDDPSGAKLVANESDQEPGVIVDAYGETPNPPGLEQVINTNHVTHIKGSLLFLASTAAPTYMDQALVEQPREQKAKYHDGMSSSDHEAIVQDAPLTLDEAGQEPLASVVVYGETPGLQQVMTTSHVTKASLGLASTVLPTEEASVEQPREHKAKSYDGMSNSEAVVQDDMLGAKLEDGSNERDQAIKQPGQAAKEDMLFELLRVKADKLDLSFVEKVITSPEGILRLCNTVSPGSAVSKEGGIVVDFDALNKVSFAIIGFYGSKKVVLSMLERLDLLAESLKQTAMEDDLQPGLYGILRGTSLYVFYWHQGSRMLEASREDPSCNFVRYLFDLCQSVYICLDEEDMYTELSLDTGAAKTSRHSLSKRTQRFELVTAEDSKHDVVVRDGFQISSPSSANVQAHLQKTHLDKLPSNLRSKLSEGSLTAALLTPIECLEGSTTSMVNYAEKVKLTKVPAIVKGWFSSYIVDVNDLPLEQLADLVKHSHIEGEEQYSALLHDHRTRNETYEECRGLAKRKTNQEKIVTNILSDLIRIYRRTYYAWEEMTLGTWTHEQLGKRVRLDSKSSSLDGMPRQHDDDGAQELLSIESSLCKAWTGYDCSELDTPTATYQLVFVGSSFLLVEDDDGTLDKAVYDVVEHHSSNEAGASGPIMMKENFEVVLRADGTKCIMCCFPIEGECPVGPLITSQRYHISLNKGEKPIYAQIRLIHEGTGARSNGLLKWIHSFGKDMIPHLAANGNLLCAVLKNSDHFDNSVISDIRLRLKDLATSKFPKVYYDQQFSASKLAQLVTKLADTRNGSSDGVDSSKSSDYEGQMDEDVLTAYKALYRKCCKDLTSKIMSNIVKREIMVAMEQACKSVWDQGRKALRKSLEKERDEFLVNIKDKLRSAPDSSKLKLSIIQFSVNEESSFRKTAKRIPYVESMLGDRVVTIRYELEQVKQENISWALSEFIPSKKDLDVLRMNKCHVVSQILTSETRLITLDSRKEEMWKVVVLSSGLVLVFVKSSDSELLSYLSPKVGSRVGDDPIHQFRRGFDLVAIDEVDCYMAMYDRGLGEVHFYKLHSSPNKWIPCASGTKLLLREHSGSQGLTTIMLRHGHKELVLLDDAKMVRVFQFNPQGHGKMKPKSISMQREVAKASITPNGSCLLLICRSEDSLDRAGLDLIVYDLESLSELKVVSLRYTISNTTFLDVANVRFESQLHLVLYDASSPSRGLCSRILDINSPSKGYVVQMETSRQEDVRNSIGSEPCAALVYIALVFQKYSTNPPLMESEKDLHLHIVLGAESTKIFQKRCRPFVEASLKKVEQVEGKKVPSRMQLVSVDHLPGYFEPHNLVDKIKHLDLAFGDWVRLLMCIAPIQICRAEKGRLRPLRNGLQIPQDADYSDAISLSRIIEFGFYDAILTHWPGVIKIISSMGKQSSGKSFLLNHLSGSVLDVAGGRCTDGVWMTVRTSGSCLYMLLDFEGLGSFDRSEQEDMLLSTVNAALSNVTIFNQKESNLDKEIDKLFRRIQSAAAIVKHDTRLFKGLFLMAIKDVSDLDVEAARDDTRHKFSKLCSESPDTFMANMYGRKFQIVTMPPFQHTDYYEVVSDIADTVKEAVPIYMNGRSLLTDMKLLIAQICANDWDPISSKRVTLRLEQLRSYLDTAICSGGLGDESDSVLINFDTMKLIHDEKVLRVDDYVFEISDTNLELMSSEMNEVPLGDIIRNLREEFERGVSKSVVNDQEWHSGLENFLMAVAERRSARVLVWLDCNTDTFKNEGDVQILRQEAIAALAGMKHKLSICRCKCHYCFFRCVLEKGHKGNHTCCGTHLCRATCDFCADQEGTGTANDCKHRSGHDGQHICKELSHTCGQACHLLGKSSNCTHACALEPKHAGEHVCNVRQHFCDQKCSLPDCTNRCTLDVTIGQHARHVCQERRCPMDCGMAGCMRGCGSLDHFHHLTGDSHLCGNTHTCPDKCEAEGKCEIVTEIVKLKTTYWGVRSNFEYELSQQSGRKKDCCIPIPSGMKSHPGPHSHTTNPDFFHFCEVQCPNCGYFCTRRFGHDGLHETTHGNMKKVSFAAELEEIDIGERLYAWGESGIAEICQMHCKAMGRGHVHLVKCPKNDPRGVCADELPGASARHQVKAYGPDFYVEKDEYTHEKYWEHIHFKDPCSKEDAEEFALCNHYCQSREHELQAGADVTALSASRSYCTELLFHEPVPYSGESNVGYVSRDGHCFSCEHADTKAHHVLFVIDRSSSMGCDDMKPTFQKVKTRHDNRLGCVYESVLGFLNIRLAAGCRDAVSFILFNHEAEVPVTNERLRGGLLNPLLQSETLRASGCTAYSVALLKAKSVLRSAEKATKQNGLAPAVIFLSDGENQETESQSLRDPVSLIREMKVEVPDLVFHTVLFARDNTKDGRTLLESMAKAGGGNFQLSLDELGLATSFDLLARSLQPQVASLV